MEQSTMARALLQPDQIGFTCFDQHHHVFSPNPEIDVAQQLYQREVFPNIAVKAVQLFHSDAV